MILANNLIFGRKYAIPNLVSAFKFQDNVSDALGNNVATAYNITYDTGKVGKSAKFNGSSSYVGIARTASLDFASTGFTVMMSIYKSATGDVTFLSCRDTNAKAEYQVGYTEIGTSLSFTIFSGGAITSNISVSENMAIPLDTWINYAFVYGGGTTDLKIYRNGSLVSSGVSTSGTFVAMTNTTSRLVLGKNGYSGLALYDGREDEVYVFNKALTATEIATYNAIINSGNSIV